MEKRSQRKFSRKSFSVWHLSSDLKGMEEANAATANEVQTKLETMEPEREKPENSACVGGRMGRTSWLVGCDNGKGTKVLKDASKFLVEM